VSSAGSGHATGRRIALAGTGFYGYIHSISRALERLGHQVRTVAYPNMRNGWRSAPRRLGVRTFENLTRRRVLRALMRHARDADLVILLRGDLLRPEDLQSIRDRMRVPLVLWLIDSVRGMSNGLELARQADLVLAYNRDEVDEIRSCGTQAYFAPLAFDPERYRPLPGLARDVDVYYVGSLHTDRKQVLDRLIARLEPLGLRIVVDGPFSSRFRPIRARRTMQRYPSLARVARNRTVSHEHINLMTNRARICLNLLPSQATDALNIRAYEISGAGGFQLINRRPIPTGLLEDGADAVGFASPDEMVEQVQRFLAPANRARRLAVAAAALKRASAAMTFDVRVQELLCRVDTCCRRPV